MGPKAVSQIKMASLRASTDDSGMSASIGNGSVWRLSRAGHLRFAQTAFGMAISSRQSLIWTLTEDRVVIEDYRNEYNAFRPHSKLGYLSPPHLRGKEGPPIPVSGWPTASLRRGWTTTHQPTTTIINLSKTNSHVV